MNSFEQAVRDALKPIAGTFAYESIVQNHLDTDKYRPWAQLINQFKPVKDSTVFCSGCGSGNEFPSYFELGAKKICGVEVEQPLVDLAHLRFKDTPQEHLVDVQLYDGDHVPYPDGFFDIASSIHVIEHVKDMNQYVKELCRVLKPGGLIFIDYPNRFYPLEQHTGKKWIHLLPHPVSQFIVKSVLYRGQWIPSFKRDMLKFKALEGYCPPFPGDIIKSCRVHGQPLGIEVEKAYFHSYGAMTIPFEQRWKRLRTVYFKMSTFTVILRRKATLGRTRLRACGATPRQADFGPT